MIGLIIVLMRKTTSYLISGWSRCVEPLLIHSLAAPGGRLALKPLPVRNATLVTRAPDLSSTHIGALKSHFSAFFFFFYQQRVFSPPLKFDSPARPVLQKTRCGEVLSLQAAFWKDHALRFVRTPFHLTARPKTFKSALLVPCTQFVDSRLPL